MIKKIAFRTAALLVSGTLLSSCAATPENCQLGQNTTTTSAVFGAGAGLALGGLAAGLSGQRGGAAAGIVVGAAVIGAAIGVAIAHAHDEACHQLALKQALDLAQAENARVQQEAAARQEAQQAAQAEEAEREAKQAEQVKTKGRKAKVPSVPPSAPEVAPEPAPKPEYMTVTWADKMTNDSGAITPLADVTDASAPDKQVCMSFSDTQNINGQSKTVLGKACRAPNGDWHPV